MKSSKVQRRRGLYRLGENDLAMALDFLERYGRLSSLDGTEKGEEGTGGQRQLPLFPDHDTGGIKK